MSQSRSDSELKATVESYFEYRPDGFLVRRINRGKGRTGMVVGSKAAGGYVCVCVNGRNELIHRLVFLMHHGYLPRTIDHINRNRLDNRIENLRSVTPAQNCWNTEKFKGFFLHKQTGKWRAVIRTNYKRRYLGLFNTQEEARAAYLVAKAERDAA